jgi:phosphinothricin acetyltransferase
MPRPATRTDVTIRPAALADLPALTDIYNHYVINTAVTFDLEPLAPADRRGWFADHPAAGPHRLFVAADGADRLVGYATTSRWRPKPAYHTTVEASIYLHPDATGRGVGARLYSTLFASIAGEDVHRIVAGVCLPNAASVTLHERFGFQLVGVFREVGFKFGRYWDVAWYERPLTL